MKKIELAVVTALVITFGTLMHFVHELPFFNHFLGYIFPTNECVWEHMKMVVWPLLLASTYLCVRKKSIKHFGGLVLTSLLSIPAQIGLFYIYWPFTHHSVLIFDIILYTGVMIAATILGVKWSENKNIQKTWGLWVAVAAVEIVVLGYLTYYPLDMIFFYV